MLHEQMHTHVRGKLMTQMGTNIVLEHFQILKSDGIMLETEGSCETSMRGCMMEMPSIIVKQ